MRSFLTTNEAERLYAQEKEETGSRKSKPGAVTLHMFVAARLPALVLL